MPEAQTTAGDMPLTEGQLRTLKIARERLDQLQASYKFWSFVFGCTATWNDSVAELSRVHKTRPKSRSPAKRADPSMEILLNSRARRRAQSLGENTGSFDGADVFQAGKALLGQIKSNRRPPNLLLRFHVQAFIVLWREATGTELVESLRRNGVYDPHFHAPIDQVLPEFFRNLDPKVTTTAIALIVRDARQTGTLNRKIFNDFFPFEVGAADPDTGLPRMKRGYTLEAFELSLPIYISDRPG